MSSTHKPSLRGKTGIQHGNAASDTAATRGWLLGNFVPRGNLRHTDNVEVKWATHRAGEVRSGWTPADGTTTLCLLVSGTFELIFRNERRTLREPGDYVLWGPDEAHTWQAPADCITLTIRWRAGAAHDAASI